MGKLFIHLGYPKTGSSFIQRELLSQNSAVNMINIKWDEKHVVDDFLAGIKETDLLKDYIEIRLIDGKINILSCEDFSGEFTTNLNFFRILKELSELFPDSIPVICLRDHYSYLESMYKHCVRRGFCGDRKAFYNIYEKDKSKGFAFYPTATLLQKLKFSDYVQTAANLFGKVRIMNFHKLTNIDTVATEIHKTFAIDLSKNEMNFVVTNEGHNDISVVLQRIVNRVVRSVYNSGGLIHPRYTKYAFHGSKLISPGIKVSNMNTWKKILAADNEIIKTDIEKLKMHFDFSFESDW